MIYTFLLQLPRRICYTEDGKNARMRSAVFGQNRRAPPFFVLFRRSRGGLCRAAEARLDLMLFYAPLPKRIAARYKEFLSMTGLRDEGDADVVALMTDDDLRVVACGARAGHTLKQFAVSPDLEGEGAFATVLSELLNEAARANVKRLFLCTKPKNRAMFASMGFYPIVETGDAVLMEDRKNGFSDYLASLPRYDGACGAVVVNGDPFTRGHLHLCEYAAAHCNALYVFSVSEPGSMFTPEERFEMLAEGTAHLKNVHVVHTEEYLVSRETFPAYFIRDEQHADAVKADLDVELFRTRIAPALHITKRFVGEEPFSPTTRAYNERMKALLPECGIELIEIPRLDSISASRVRALIREGSPERTKDLVPDTTYAAILRKLSRNA